MSFSKITHSLTEHILPVLVSVIVATAMWYMVSVRDMIEAQYDVNIDYVGIPKDLVVTDGLVNKITLRLRGPETLLRALNNQRLNHQIDLSSIKKGVTIVPLTTERVASTYRAFEVLDVQPPRVVIKADTIVERSVPVQPVISSPLRSGVLSVKDVSVDPPTVMLWGPESVVLGMTRLNLDIELDPKTTGTVVTQTLPLDSPSLVSVTPKTVKVTYTITSRRSVIDRTYKITLNTDEPSLYSVEPSTVTLQVEVPDALSKSNSYLSNLKLTAIPPADLKPGETASAQIVYTVPDGMEVVTKGLDTVTVKRME